MRIRFLFFLSSLLLTAPLFANETKIYSSYESVRQALLTNSISDVQKTATELASVAKSEEQEVIAVQAETLTEATDMASARKVFAALSDEVITFRAAGCCKRPAVAYCAMVKQSWLQPAAAPISNPYVDEGMRTCGKFVNDEPAHEHHHQ